MGIFQQLGRGWLGQGGFERQMSEASGQELKHVFIVLSEHRGWPIPPFQPLHQRRFGILTLEEMAQLGIQPDQNDTPRNSHDDVRERVHVSSLVHPLYPKQITAQGE